MAARARLLKPEFFKSEELAEVSLEARLLYAGLWTLADREGLLEDRPKRIRAEVFPYDDVDVNARLDELVAVGVIRRYEAEGLHCICIPTFLKHQKPHPREAGSTLPPPEGRLKESPGEPGEVHGAPKASPGAAQADGFYSGIGSSSVSVAVSGRAREVSPAPLAAAAANEPDIKRCTDAWTSATGQTVTQQTGESIADWCERVGPQWVLDAIEETGRSPARAWRYTASILQRWETEGRTPERSNQHGRNTSGATRTPPRNDKFAHIR